MDSKKPLGKRGAPPALPPRGASSSSLSPSSSSMMDIPPPSYEDAISIQLSSASMAGQQLGAGDPRSSSTQSLVPSENAEERHEHNDHRRKLLMIYIHGFMGNETSFRSFPAHVHNLLAVLLAETHVVHTKIYPRYKSKRNIIFARDDFSQWLEPHVDNEVDVVLLGHSMGGLLCGEVVLKPADGEGYAGGRGVFKHKILGTINFDVPFLGMHPGIVKSGLASLFAPGGEESKPGDKYTSDDVGSGSDGAPGTPGPSMSPRPSGRSDTFWTPGQPDPNFNPSFGNDVVLPVRKGWESAWHFISKHATSASDLGKATKKLVTSHLEFGGAMANYSELKLRYVRLRALEEESDDIRRSVVKNTAAFGVPPRVRFVNYYTACTGRVKKIPEEETLGESLEEQAEIGASESRASLDVGDATARSSVRSTSPRISLDEYGESGIVHKDVLEPMQQMAPTPIDEDEFDEMVPTPVDNDDEDHVEEWQDAAESVTIGNPGKSNEEAASNEVGSLRSSSSVQVPEMPSKPPPLDVSFIKDETTRKLVEKEYSRAMKAYEKAVKEREKTIQNSTKAQEKQDQKAKKDAEKAKKEAEKARLKLEKEKAKAEQKAKKQKEKPESEMTHAEKEERRMKQEKLRMENEGRRMRGEPQLSALPEDEELSIEEDAVEEVGEGQAQDSSRPSTIATTSYRTESDTTLRSPSPSIAPGQSFSTSRRTSTSNTSRSAKKASESKKPKKERKFCTLPPKDSRGERDPCWIRVFMENVDEVGAHCGLFFVDERYERLVGDVAERVEGWVNEEFGRRVAEGNLSPVEDYRGDVKIRMQTTD